MLFRSSREDAYRLVQHHAMAVWQEGGRFLDRLVGDPEVTGHLDASALASLFDLSVHTRHVDTIFERVFAAE